MNRRAIRRRRVRELGSSGMILVVLISLLVSILAAGMIRVSTFANLLFAREYYAARAEDNAPSGAIIAETVLEKQLGEILRQAADTAETSGAVNLRAPVFVGATFKPIHWEFDLSTDEYGPDERAVVDVFIRLSGPPVSRTLAGMSGERKDVIIDEYDFTVEIRSTGYSSMNTKATAVEFASQKLWVLSGPPDAPLIAKINSGTFGREAGKSDAGEGLGEGLGEAMKGSTGVVAIPSGTVVMGSLSGAVVTPAVPNVSDGTWQGDPEIVSGPIRYGMDRGDALYVYELKGVPPGTRGLNPNTTVLCTDDWRTSMTTYNRGTDTADFYEGPSNALNHRRGTPWYAVVAVRPPSAGQGLTLPGGTGQLVLPNGRAFELPPLPDSWQAETQRITAPDGRQYRVTAEPYEPVQPLTSGGNAYFVNNESGPNGTRPTASGSEVEHSSVTVKVGGYAQDLANGEGALSGVAHHYSGTGPIQIGLVTVFSRRNQLNITMSGIGSSAPVFNSKNYIMNPDDPIDPVGPPPPPGGGCSNCPPPTPTIALLAWMFVPSDIALVPDELNQK